jgi:putative ABC transport system ATP-binding protein
MVLLLCNHYQKVVIMIARLEDAKKVYRSGNEDMTALHPTSLVVVQGELLLIVGPSGSGKTTLLSLLGCLINPTTGKLFISGQEVNKLNTRQMAAIRLSTIGFVFQQFNLLSPLTAEQNVAFPLKLQSLPALVIRHKTAEALDKVNMGHKRHKLPKTLSGGEQQRIAIARALVTDPKLVLCDEPTASLDKISLEVVMQQLQSLARSGKAVVVVTHDPRLYQYADRIIEVDNGVVKFLAHSNASTF